MTPLEKQLATMRGETLAAQILADAALQMLFMIVNTDREKALAGLTAFIDDILNRAGPATGDPHDELNTLMRETARFQAMQALDNLAQMRRK